MHQTIKPDMNGSLGHESISMASLSITTQMGYHGVSSCKMA
jgi:hypothetical protein